ncbi:hypothetical protein lerEdw1_019494 [Lerista edwardsae]|nr:hypothetical protein lerEdw1_019494 [Lerista edwardsae]
MPVLVHKPAVTNGSEEWCLSSTFLPLPNLFLFCGRPAACSPLASMSRTKRCSLTLIFGNRHDTLEVHGAPDPVREPWRILVVDQEQVGNIHTGGADSSVHRLLPRRPKQRRRALWVGNQSRISFRQFLFSRGHRRALLERPRFARTSERLLKRTPVSILSKTNCC